MTRYLLQRLISALFVLFAVSIIVFILIRMAPGDPTANLVGTEGSQEQRQRTLDKWGLNDPYYVQYPKWIWNAAHGDFGDVLASGRPVTSVVLPRLPVSLVLATTALIVSIIIGIPLGVIAALRHRGVVDLTASAFGITGLAIPNFWLALMAIYLFSIKLGWLPALGWVQPWDDPIRFLKTAAMPGITLGLPGAATLTRMVRTSMLDVLGEDYVRTARAKGLSPFRVIWTHAFRNALLPPLTAIGLLAGSFLAGSVIIEQIFVIPGMGTAFINAIQQRDYPTIQFLVLVYAAAFVTINILTDITYGLVDPRVLY
jgi:peptide/nickel transport system permease protein